MSRLDRDNKLRKHHLLGPHQIHTRQIVYVLHFPFTSNAPFRNTIRITVDHSNPFFRSEFDHSIAIRKRLISSVSVSAWERVGSVIRIGVCIRRGLILWQWWWRGNCHGRIFVSFSVLIWVGWEWRRVKWEEHWNTVFTLRWRLCFIWESREFRGFIVL